MYSEESRMYPRGERLGVTVGNTSNKITCPVCYEDYNKRQMQSLVCDHKFCKTCVYEHLSQAISSGKAVTIKCMQDGCPERYMRADVAPLVKPEQLKVYESVNQDVLVG